MSHHTLKAFDVDLGELNSMIAAMGVHAEGQVVQAIDSLIAGDCANAEEVVVSDNSLDSRQRAIEQKAVATIATRQPVADDLREIIGVLRIASELERVGDLAKNISKRVQVLNGKHLSPVYLQGVLQLARLASELVRNALQSYAE